MGKIRSYVAALAATLLFLFWSVAGQAAVRVEAVEQGQGEFTVNELSPPSLRPFVLTAKGKWVVEPVQVDNKTWASAKDTFERAVRSISKKLKPFPRMVNDRWVRPWVVITPVFIGELNHPGKAAGWYDPDYNVLVLTWRAMSNGELGVRYTFAHELGHWAWNNILTEEEKHRYQELVGEPNQDDLELAGKYGVDPEVLVLEWFAEDFRLYACGVEDGGEVSSKLGVSRARADELREFFKKWGNNVSRAGHIR